MAAGLDCSGSGIRIWGSVHLAVLCHLKHLKETCSKKRTFEPFPFSLSNRGAVAVRGLRDVHLRLHRRRRQGRGEEHPARRGAVRPAKHPQTAAEHARQSLPDVVRRHPRASVEEANRGVERLLLAPLPEVLDLHSPRRSSDPAPRASGVPSGEPGVFFVSRESADQSLRAGAHLVEADRQPRSGDRLAGREGSPRSVVRGRDGDEPSGVRESLDADARNAVAMPAARHPELSVPDDERVEQRRLGARGVDLGAEHFRVGSGLVGRGGKGKGQ